ncbi:MAG: hypothetical protein ACN6O1_17790 [Comamonas sp.]|uniref:hypothetical protein n=1 Tax=Comamonas sp. TaxID=34028 RepID=UPI003D14EBA5
MVAEDQRHAADHISLRTPPGHGQRRAPAKTSPGVLAQLNRALQEALNDADARGRLTTLGVRSKDELDRYGAMFSAIGVKID